MTYLNSPLEDGEVRIYDILYFDCKITEVTQTSQDGFHRKLPLLQKLLFYHSSKLTPNQKCLKP
jgi:hypothetical protein